MLEFVGVIILGLEATEKTTIDFLWDLSSKIKGSSFMQKFLT